MTIIAGNIQDIGYQPLSGTLTATSVGFRDAGGTLVAPESRSWPIVAGVVSVTLLPGPARLTISVGSHARDEWDVMVPDSDIELATLIEDSIEWAPPIVSVVGEHRRAAEAAAERAEASAVGAEAARSDAAWHRDTAMGYRDEAQTAQGAAAGSATAAASSASAAAGSASAANSSAGTATAQAGVASTAAGTATSRAGEAAGSASAAAGSATAAAGFADDAELWATSFGLTATSTTDAPGTNASVTVTGSGPEYGLAFTVPRGDKGEQGVQGAKGTTGDAGPKGDKGDPGEVTTTQLNTALAGKADLVGGKVPTSQLPALGAPGVLVTNDPGGSGLAPVAGDSAAAVGYGAIAWGNASAAFGYGASASGDLSAAVGYGAQAPHHMQITLGLDPAMMDGQLRHEVHIPGTLVLYSPDGNMWALNVDNSGNVSTSAWTPPNVSPF